MPVFGEQKELLLLFVVFQFICSYSNVFFLSQYFFFHYTDIENRWVDDGWMDIMHDFMHAHTYLTALQAYVRQINACICNKYQKNILAETDIAQKLYINST